jgi:23S rRNA pseudouridine1911/1915/1917 synthase
MNRTFERVVSEKMRGHRLDHFLLESGIGLSRNQASGLIGLGNVLVNGRPAKPSYKVKPDDHVTASFETEAPFTVEPEAIPLRIAYEDSEVVVVDKPPGIVVHPARGHSQHTLVNALLHHCGDLPAGATGKIRPGVLHRLDKDTTGLLVFAKTDESLTNLGRQVEARKFTREYQAVVWGDLGLETGTIDAPVGRSSLNRKRMAVTPFASRTAVTRFETVQRFGIATLVKVRLLTGRTHQIRVHMTHYGHPVVGDPEYGGRSREVVRCRADVPVFEQMLEVMKRQALHAARLGFWHPQTGKYIEFNSPLPEDMAQLLTYLRSRRPGPAVTRKA